jgi:hypothetical protein
MSTTKTFHGSCHCKRIRFEADIDLSEGTGKCNCTSCWKKRWWSVKVKPEAFRSAGGVEHLSAFKPGQERGHRGFCTHCGVIPYGWVDKSEWNPAEYVSVNVAALDDLDPADLVGAPVTY